MKKNKVSVIGLGYVGMPLMLAIRGCGKYEVFGYDIDQRRVLELKKKGLKASTSPDLIQNSEYVVICVPTPVKNSKQPDLSFIISATKIAANYLEKGQKIIVESTVNPGVCEEIVLPILEKTGLKANRDFVLAHCPERINPGDKKWNVLNIPRNVGAGTRSHCRLVANFYRNFLKARVNEVSSLKVAEATKIIENTFRDINIAYVNELAKSFDLMDIDLVEVINAASNKPFSFMPHYPGCGVGGHCIPVDPYYLIARAKKSGFDHSFLRKARAVNNSMPAYAVSLLIERLSKINRSIRDVVIGVLGLAYKPDVADLRESAALEIVRILKNKKAKIVRYDPYIKGLSDVKNIDEFLEKVDVVIVATYHRQFAKIKAEDLKKNGVKILIDGRNSMNKEAILKSGIIYKGIGH